jgi:hypothetical protein
MLHFMLRFSNPLTVFQYGNLTDPYIPAAFADAIGSVLGLSNSGQLGAGPPYVPRGSPNRRHEHTLEVPVQIPNLLGLI